MHDCTPNNNKRIKTEEYDKPGNDNIKTEIKEEMVEDYEVQNTLEQNIDTALKTRSLGLAGK